MKKKILMFAMLLGITCTVAAAKPGNPTKNVTARASNVIEAFVDAHMHGDAAMFNAILHTGAQLKLNRQGEVVMHSKSELVNFYKKSGLIQLNCTSDYTILSSNDCAVMARVDFKFPEFVQQHYVTIEKDKKGQWRISQINQFNS